VCVELDKMALPGRPTSAHTPSRSLGLGEILYKSLIQSLQVFYPKIPTGFCDSNSMKKHVGQRLGILEGPVARLGDTYGGKIRRTLRSAHVSRSVRLTDLPTAYQKCSYFCFVDPLGSHSCPYHEKRLRSVGAKMVPDGAETWPTLNQQR
jgi:hypothetical protein